MNIWNSIEHYRKFEALVFQIPHLRQAQNRWQQKPYGDSATLNICAMNELFVDNLLDFKSPPKNKFVKKPTHANAQNTLSFFADTQADPKKMKECFLHKKTIKNQTNSPLFGGCSF
ncbi:MAG: hypothetical protein IPK61_07900 [Saprospiraceae bacterium]|nr:hypothetical protein [Saprospiraceae bacterium]